MLKATFATLTLAVLAGFFTGFFWLEDIDAMLHKRQTARVLAPLDKKIAAAEISQLSAATGLKGQREKILQSVAQGYHPYLLPENRIFVDRLKRLNAHPFSGFVESVAGYLYPFLKVKPGRLKTD